MDYKEVLEEQIMQLQKLQESISANWKPLTVEAVAIAKEIRKLVATVKSLNCIQRNGNESSAITKTGLQPD